MECGFNLRLCFILFATRSSKQMLLLTDGFSYRVHVSNEFYSIVWLKTDRVTSIRNQTSWMTEALRLRERRRCVASVTVRNWGLDYLVVADGFIHATHMSFRPHQVKLAKSRALLDLTLYLHVRESICSGKAYKTFELRYHCSYESFGGFSFTSVTRTLGTWMSECFVVTAVDST